jgi:hypothetical protein
MIISIAQFWEISFADLYGGSDKTKNPRGFALMGLFTYNAYESELSTPHK